MRGGLRESLAGMLRGMGGGGGAGLGGGRNMNISAMPGAGGLSGGGARMGGGGVPSVSAPGTADPLRDPRSALAHGDDLIKGWWEEAMPTPRQKQARTNADLFAQALVGGEGQQGLLGQNITPELIAQAAGNMRKNGADAEGLLGFAQWAAPAMAAQQDLAWKQRKADADEAYRRAMIEKVLAQTDNTRAAGARAAAKGAGGGGGSDPDLAFLKP